METNKYKALLKAVELGSITAAAQELGYSPSGLTRLLDGLEKDLGFPVLTRGPQGVGFTHEGEELLPVFRELLHWQGRLNEYCAAIRGLEQGELFVGSYYSIAARWLPTILQKFQRDYPGIRIHVQEAGNSRLLEGLQERRLSCVLFSRPQNYSGEWLPLYSDRYVAWIPESFPQARRRPHSLRRLLVRALLNPFPTREPPSRLFSRSTISSRMCDLPPAICTPAGAWWKRGWAFPWTMSSALPAGRAGSRCCPLPPGKNWNWAFIFLPTGMRPQPLKNSLSMSRILWLRSRQKKEPPAKSSKNRQKNSPGYRRKEKRLHPKMERNTHHGRSVL